MLLPFFWSLAVALAATLPVYHRLDLWADDNGDWPEVVSHLATTRMTIAGGEFPFWNPYLCGGSPNLANPQPFFLATALPLSFVVGDVVATKLALTLGIALSVLGTFFLAITLGLRGPPAYLASLVFPLSGFAVSHLANGQLLWLALGWVPWIIAGYLRSLRGSRAGTLLAAGLLSLTFIEGRVYLVAYVALFLTILALTISAQRRNTRPLVSLVLIGSLVLGLSAWKLLPSLVFLADAETSLPNTRGLPLAALKDAFLQRDLSPNVTDSFGAQEIPRHEYAAYVGILPLLLSAFSLRRRTWATVWPFALAGGAFMLLALQTPATSPLEYLPLARELRNPSRMLSMVTLTLTLLAGFGFSELLKLSVALRFSFLTRWVLPLLVVTAVSADLLAVSRQQFSRLFIFPAATETYSDPGFFQTRLPERQPANGYVTILAGKGAKDFCPAVLHAYRTRSDVRAREDSGYRGEAYALGDARVTLSRFRANSLDIHVEAAAPDTVVVNQTNDRGWSATPFPTSRVSSLLAAAVPAGSHELHFRYRPPGLNVGLAITVVTILILLLKWLRRRG